MSELIPFGDRLQAAFAEYGHLCVGLDPHATLLGAWGQPDSADGMREFGLRVIEAAAGRVGILKPQVAFFERHGAAGYAVLERLIRAMRARGTGSIVNLSSRSGQVGIPGAAAYASSKAAVRNHTKSVAL